MKIEIPTELRQEILEYKTSLESRRSTHAAQLEKATRDLTELRAAESELSSEIAALENSTRHDDETGVEKLTKLQTRLRLVSGKIPAAEAAMEQAQSEAVPLGSASLIRDVCHFYMEHLPELLASELQPFCESREAAYRIARQTDAVQTLRSLRDNQAWAFDASATPANIQRTLAILERALKGDPALTFIAPQFETSAQNNPGELQTA